MALVLDGLVKRFGKITALDGISFQVERGSVFGFLGANGAGKTTTMRIVLDILKPDAGTVTWDGGQADEAPRETWGYLPEERGLYARLEVLGQLVSDFAKSRGGAPVDVGLVVTGLTALLDGLWLQLCLDPTSIRPKDAAALCNDWVDRVIRPANPKG